MYLFNLFLFSFLTSIMSSELTSRLSLKLFSELRKSECVFSPVSILFALSLVHQATTGNTDNQLTELFGGKFSVEDLKTLQDSLKGNGLVSVSNICAISEKVGDVNAEMLSSLQSVADVSVENFDNPDPVRRKLNSAVSEVTHGLINEIIQRIDKRTVMLIVNAVYFKAQWKFKFEPTRSIDNASFYSALDQSTKRITMMAMKESKKVPYFENDVIQLVELPYLLPSSTSTSDFAMGIILPKNREEKYTPDGDLHQHISQLTTENDVQVKIPKFTMRKRVELIPVLKDLGVSDLFSKTACDLSKLVASNNAHVSEIIHEAVIIVDEAGTEAAAATVVHVMKLAMRRPMNLKVFEADHSFVYYVRHIPSNSFVFMGEYHGV